jgi:hypothetical protein
LSQENNIDSSSIDSTLDEDGGGTSRKLHVVPVREEMVLQGINFLSHPRVRDDVKLHSKFLKRKGLTAAEIQEVLQRTSFTDDFCNDYDPIYLMPSVAYEEFLFRLKKPHGAGVLKRFKQ